MSGRASVTTLEPEERPEREGDGGHLQMTPTVLEGPADDGSLYVQQPFSSFDRRDAARRVSVVDGPALSTCLLVDCSNSKSTVMRFVCTECWCEQVFKL